MSTTRIVVIAKAPQPGRVKTRLIPALGAEGAAALAARMLACTLVAAFEAAGAADTADPALGVVELCASPAPGDPAWQGVVVPAGLRWSAQGEG
ncbi:MAG TPA: glycosyltransferase, partial [Thauera aminoaromatica]|nr:glycosyltransferase [Thauera aminoaromatica]